MYIYIHSDIYILRYIYICVLSIYTPGMDLDRDQGAELTPLRYLPCVLSSV